MDSLEAWDLGILYDVARRRQPWLTDVFRAVTVLGDPLALVLVATLGTIAFAVARRSRLAAILAATALISWGVEWGVKALVRRPRPGSVEYLIPLPNGPSFPSGHALCSMAIYGTLGLLLAHELRPGWPRYLAGGAGIALGLLIGATRPYLGDHYPTDVVAGWCAGLACALLASTAASPNVARDSVAGPAN